MLAKAEDQFAVMVAVLTSSRASSLPQVFVLCADAVITPHPPCGSGLARENGGSVCDDVGCADAFASKPAPTGFCTCPDIVNRPCGSELARDSGASVTQMLDVSRFALDLDLDLGAPLNHAGRTQALRSGHPGMDAGIAALGHGWPFAAAHGAMPSFGHAEPRRGTEWWGKSVFGYFWRFSKSDPP